MIVLSWLLLIALVDAIDTALAELRAEGVLAELGEKYFGEDVSQ